MNRSNSTLSYVFHIEAGADDALLRVLGVFIVLSTAIRAVEMTCSQDQSVIRVEAGELDFQRAQTLVHRLRNMAIVRKVELVCPKGATLPA